MSSSENKPPCYCLNYILSLWIAIVYLDVVFPLFSMRLKRHTHETKTQMKDGKERGRGARWPPHIEHFPVDSVEGFSAAWLNEQRHANEWRTNVIIYQTKSGRLWEMETRGGGGGGRKGPTLLKIFRKDLPSNSYLKLVPCSRPWRFFRRLYIANA